MYENKNSTGKAENLIQKIAEAIKTEDKHQMPHSTIFSNKQKNAEGLNLSKKAEVTATWNHISRMRSKIKDASPKNEQSARIITIQTNEGGAKIIPLSNREAIRKIALAINEGEAKTIPFTALRSANYTAKLNPAASLAEPQQPAYYPRRSFVNNIESQRTHPPMSSKRQIFAASNGSSGGREY